MSSVSRNIRIVFADRLALQKKSSRLRCYKTAGAELLRIANNPKALRKFVDRFPLQVTGTRTPSPVKLFERDQLTLLLESNKKKKLIKGTDVWPKAHLNARKLYQMLPISIQKQYAARCEHLKKLNSMLKTAVRKGNADGRHVYSSRIWKSLPDLPNSTFLDNLMYKGRISARKWNLLDNKTKESCRREAEQKRLLKYHVINELEALAKKSIKEQCKDLVLQRRW